MSDGIVVEKKEISDTQYLYGCEIGDLPIDVPYEITKHKAQIIKGKALSDKLYDRATTIRNRIVKVNDAVNWNQLMLDKLEKGK
jgi:hypothetical protein